MLHRLSEESTFGRSPDLSRFRAPVVFAPHPDDEVYGCGGLLAHFAAKGTQAHAVIFTRGEAQGLPAANRMAESERAAEVLGYTVECWDWPDRAVECTEPLIGRMADWLEAHPVDLLLVPALSEPHPDHQGCTLALACALGRLRTPHRALPEVWLYESGGALTHATCLIDISAVRAQKQVALQCFISQEAVQPYAARIEARDRFRALTLGPDCEAAEAFHVVNLPQRGWPAWIAAMEPLFLQDRDQASSPGDVPLISVLVRTIGDPHLPRTLASVWAQTYSRIEVVVVAAHGEAHPPEALTVPAWRANALKWVSVDTALRRPAAANLALASAQGDLCIFLDDDDLWLPDHLQGLLNALHAEPGSHAAHSDVRVVNGDGEELTRYEGAFRRERLLFTNVLPIHSVLFERGLVTQRGLRFDESLPVLEDWDFWLQLTSHTQVAHSAQLTALYRYRDRSGLEQRGVHDHAYWKQKVVQRWWECLEPQALQAAAAWYAAALDSKEQLLRVKVQEAFALRRTNDEQTQTLSAAEARLAAEASALSTLERDRAQWLQERADLLDGTAHLRSELAVAADRTAQLHARVDTQQAESVAKALECESLRNELNSAERQIAVLHATSDALRSQVAAQAAQCSSLRVELATAGSQLSLRHAEAQRSQEAVHRFQTETQQLRKEVQRLVAEASSQHAETTRLHEQLTQTQLALQTQAEALGSARAHARDLQESLTNVRLTLQSREEALRETRDLAISRHAIAERWEQEARALQNALDITQAQQRATAAELTQAMQRLTYQTARADHSDALSSRLELLISELRAELLAMHTSTSWNLTRPVRWLGSLLRRRS